MNQKQIEKDYAKMLLVHSTDNPNKLNCYKCRCGHVTKTIEIHHGTTPFMLNCEKCAQPATSTMYADIVPDKKATVEWFRPTLKETLKLFRKNKGLFEHVMNGGLDYRYLAVKKTLTGIERMMLERKEQIEKHGRSVKYDVSNNPDAALLNGVMAIIVEEPDEFPTTWDKEITDHIFTKSRKEQLAIAGALMAAEIDRIQYLEDNVEA